MPKTKMNFRLSEDALMSLARLSGLWGCDRTAVIERALAEADPSEMDHEERESTEATFDPPMVSKDLGEPGKIEALPPVQPGLRPTTGGMKRVEQIPIPDWMNEPVPERTDFTPVPKGKK